MVSLQELLEQGVLVSPEVLEQGIDEKLLAKIIDYYGDDLLVLDQNLIDQTLQHTRVEVHKEESSAYVDEQQPTHKGVRIVWSYTQPSKSRSYDDFVKLLNKRFLDAEKLLKTRQELLSTISISRIRVKKERESCSCIAVVIDKSETTNGHIILNVEDRTGQIKMIISKKNSDIHSQAKDVQLDEVLGFTGMGAGDAMFADNIYYPDVPLTKEFKKSPEEEYLLCIGDLHIGSKVFMKNEFERMLLWMNKKVGNEEQKAIANKVKYLIFTGDVVEGVGIYPNQEHDLEIMDITDQYTEFARYLRQIPPHIQIIIYPGNHDAGRLSEPQEPLMRTYAQSVYDLPNVTITSNPSVVNIGATKQFPGFDCLLYHGGSFIYYSDNIPSIRAQGGQKRVDLIMKWLLQRRHLAPTHNAAMTIPTTDRDYLFIDVVPDFFITGHIHRASVSNYRNVTMINSSCWTLTTEDQVKRGLEPQPAKLVLINLRTRAAKLMNFLKEERVVTRERPGKVSEQPTNQASTSNSATVTKQETSTKQEQQAEQQETSVIGEST